MEVAADSRCYLKTWKLPANTFVEKLFMLITALVGFITDCSSLITLFLIGGPSQINTRK